MKAFPRIESYALRLLEDDVDTDQMVPARFLRTESAAGLGPYLFYDRCRAAGGQYFPLHPERYRGETILIVASNFGCGSSREHAPWALRDVGIRVLIGRSFAEIFTSNCFKNGLLPIVLPEAAHSSLVEEQSMIRVDLEQQTVRAGDFFYHFSIDPFARYCLLEGVDELAFIQSQTALIKSFEEMKTDDLRTIRRF